MHLRGSLCSSLGKESACSAGDPGSISGLGRSPGEGNDNPLQYYYLENPMNRGALWATVHVVINSPTPETTLLTTVLHLCARASPFPEQQASVYPNASQVAQQ